MSEQEIASQIAHDATPNILPEEIEKTEFLGGGQFGSVYKGKCRGMDVAIKYLENFDQDKLRDFLDEVQIMSKVLNPHVVLLLGACTSGPMDDWCMVTELCARGDLEHFLYDPETKLSLMKKYSFAIDLCLGLSWLNGKEIQVTHHDLKPANVFISQDWRIKVGDFGLAYLTIKNKEGMGVESGGSPLYESPESLQVRLKMATAEVYSEKSDVWSYSMVVWEIFKLKLIYSDDDGNLPFESAQQYYDFLESGGIPPIEGLPDTMVSVFKKCWKFNSSERPTFQDLLPLLRSARLDSFVPPDIFPEANHLWKDNFPDEGKVPIDLFLEALGSSDESKHARLLKILFWGSEEKGHNRHISLPKFRKLLYWFGSTGLSRLLSAIENLTETDFFYGIIDSKALGPLLDKPYTFLVRLNEGKTRPIEASPFFLARSDAKGKVQILSIYPSKKKPGHYYCMVPTADLSKASTSKEKETPVTGPAPGVTSLIQEIQNVTKRFLARSTGYSPFMVRTGGASNLYDQGQAPEEG